MRHFLFAILLIALAPSLRGQGCSDAGVCSAGSIHSAESDSFILSLESGERIGLGEAYTVIGNSILRLRVKVTHGSVLSLQSNYMIASGNLGQSAGPGDLLLVYSGTLYSKQEFRILGNLGAKLPLGHSDLRNSENLPLPMPYQPGLGSLDLLAGIRFYLKKWHFSAGYQHVMSRNKNEFLLAAWDGRPEAEAYDESNQLRRGDDLVVRAERIFVRNGRILSLSLLPVIRLQKDRIIKKKRELAIDGSRGLTVNLNLDWSKNLGDHFNIHGNVAAPVWWRRVRADGLTRFFVIYAGLNYKI